MFRIAFCTQELHKMIKYSNIQFALNNIVKNFWSKLVLNQPNQSFQKNHRTAFVLLLY